MPQGSSAAPRWFVKVIPEVIKYLERVAAYVDDIIVYDPDATAHTANLRALFQRLRLPQPIAVRSQGQNWRHRSRLAGTCDAPRRY